MSAELFKRQRNCLAQGETSPNSKRQSAFIRGVYPTHLVKGQGCYVWDDKGKKYIDFISGLGTNLLGYNHPSVTEAVRHAVGLGTTLSLPHPIEIEVAEKLQELIPACEKVRFLKTGNEATLAAVRIARAYWNPDEMGGWIWSEGYHGHGDLWTSLTEPHLGVVEEFKIQRSEPSNEYKGGCRIIESVQLDASDNRKGIVEGIRNESELVISDEIVTGFRFPKLTVSNTWGIKPDIICLGKGLANGLPLSVVAGRKDVMDCGEYFISSTFSGEIVSLHAAKAVLEFLETNNPKDFWDFGDSLRTKINKIIAPLDVEIEGYATRGMFDVSKLNTQLVMQECCKAGILFGKAWFPSWAHMESGIEEVTCSILTDVVTRIQQGRVKLEGDPPVETFKR